MNEHEHLLNPKCIISWTQFMAHNWAKNGENMGQSLLTRGEEQQHLQLYRPTTALLQ